MSCEILRTTLSLWGIRLDNCSVNKLCEDSIKIELKKQDVYTLRPKTIVLVSRGIVEIEEALYAAGDLFYIDEEKKLVCVSSNCQIVEVPEDLAYQVLDKQTLQKIVDTLRVVKSRGPDVPVKYFIRKLPIEANPDLTVRDAAKIMSEYNVSSIVVVDQDRRPIGIITDTDLRRFLAQEEIANKKLGEVAIKTVVTTIETESVSSALERMLMHGIKHMIIVNSEGKNVGMVTLRDLYDAFTAVPIALLRDLQKANRMEEVTIVYSRILRQVLNILTRRRVDVLEFSRNFTMAKLLTIAKLLSIVCDSADDILVLASQPLSSYDYVFGEEFTLYVISRVEKILNEVALKLRTAISKLLDISEVVRIESLLVDDIVNMPEEDLRFLDIVLLSRPVWGNVKLLEEKIDISSSETFAKIMKTFKEYVHSVELPIDIFGRLKVRHVNIFRQVVEPMTKILSVLFYMATRERPSLSVRSIIDTLKRADIIEEDLLSSIEVMFEEIKQLELKVAVRNYISKAKLSTEVDISELSEAELYHIKYSFDLLRTLKDRTRDFLGRYAAI